MYVPRPSHLPALLLVVVVTACGGAETARSEGVVVDTLANGALHMLNTGEGAWAAAGEPPWRLVEELRIGRLDGVGPDVFGSVRGVVPDALGRIWVMDSQAHELRLFDADGTHVRTVGGEGDGPGEFGFNPCMQEGPDGQIWVEAGGRWTTFDSAGTLVGTQPTTGTLGCGIRAWRGDRFIGVVSSYDRDLQEFDSRMIVHDLVEGELVPSDTFPVPDIADFEQYGEGIFAQRIPLSAQPTYRLRRDGDFWVSQGGGDYRLTRVTLEGDTVGVIERTYDPAPVPDSVRRAEIEGEREDDGTLPAGFDPSRVPDVFPPFDRIHETAGGGPTWVTRRVGASAWEFDVFDPSGVRLGSIPTPLPLERASIAYLTADHVYMVHRGEFDVPYVVRFRIERSR